MKARSSRLHRYNAERGAVLAITLLILVVVTVLGVSGMSASSLQMFLARNTLLKQISFQNAESTVFNGENTWSGLMDACLANASCTLADLHSAKMLVAPLKSDVEIEAALDASDNIVVAYNDGRWVIEYLGFDEVPGSDDMVYLFYRVSARATGPNDQAVTRIQTLYRKCMKADGSACPT